MKKEKKILNAEDIFNLLTSKKFEFWYCSYGPLGQYYQNPSNRKRNTLIKKIKKMFNV
jgi:hypothetical protein